MVILYSRLSAGPMRMCVGEFAPMVPFSNNALSAFSLGAGFPPWLHMCAVYPRK